MRSPSLARLVARRPRPEPEAEGRWPPLPDDLHLDGDRILLRWPRLADAEDVFAYAGDETVSAFMDWRPHKNPDESRRFLHFLEQNRRWGREVAFGIIERESGGLVGVCSLISQRGLTAAEVGYVLRRDLWGKGYMTEAVRLATDWAFPSLRLQEIYGDVHPKNVSSQRVLEKCGYHRRPTVVHRTIKGVNTPHYRYFRHPSETA
jgi:ribosomal-protein-alanine N-acetyltransferase